MQGQLLISEVWAYIVLDDDGTEGIPAFASPMGPMPMVGADEERMRSLRGIAEGIARDMGKQVTLCRFSVREEIEKLLP
jgi:hypothetical protein